MTSTEGAVGDNERDETLISNRPLPFLLSVYTAPHDDDLYGHLDGDLCNVVPRTYSIDIPNLRRECRTLLLDIVRDRVVPEDVSRYYMRYIWTRRSLKRVVDTLMDMVPSEIRDLSGGTIDLQRLIEIGSRQSSPWPRSGGYTNVITDKRDNRYFRIYVGQSKELEQRFLHGHCQAFLRGSYSNLHRYILWLGNGQRVANYLSLWSAPPNAEWNEQLAVQFNILQSLFCRVFASHHGGLSPKVEGRVKRDYSLGWGLNVASPLLRGRPHSEEQRLEGWVLIPRSKDPQIAYWPRFHIARQAEKERLDISVIRDTDDELYDGDGCETNPTEQSSTSMGDEERQKQSVFDSTSRAWREGKLVFRGKLYEHSVREKRTEGNLRHVCVWSLYLTLLNDLDVGDGKVHISVEPCGEGILYSDRWVRTATKDDIGGCFSFRIIGKNSKGAPFVHILKTFGDQAVFRANFFVDIFFYRKSELELARTPRRFVEYCKKTEGYEKIMELCQNGHYTPDNI
ncbi:hypothetical protein F5Y10DRAFT_292159 [Nemania abortiva]|nr:hypothetical protein F5Y10DRAFT_292159 [Nemania abortiva]